MSNNTSLVVSGKITFPWNPFQDMAICDITGEPQQTDLNSGGLIIPRNGPFFSRNFKIYLKSSGRELDFNAGEYAFVFPFGAFNARYNRLVWGGIQVKGISEPTDFIIDYSTIGGDFVLNDVAYGEAVANALTSPRTIDWNSITGLPLVWPPDPHEHPASDTMNYGDMIVYLRSYIDIITNTPNASWTDRFEQHLKDDLQQAHKADISMLGFNNIGDWAMATEADIPGNATNLITNVAIAKALIRGFSRGDWS